MIANHIGLETQINIGGKDYTLSRFTRSKWREFLKFCKEQLPDPLELAAQVAKTMPTELALPIVDKAYEDAKHFLTPASPGVLEIMVSPDGMAYLFHLLLRDHHPMMNEEETADVAFAYINKHGDEELQNLLAKACGIMPPSDEPQKKTESQQTGSTLTDQ